MSDFWHNRVNIDLKWPENETIIIIIYLFISSIYIWGHHLFKQTFFVTSAGYWKNLEGINKDILFLSKSVPSPELTVHPWEFIFMTSTLLDLHNNFQTKLLIMISISQCHFLLLIISLTIFHYRQKNYHPNFKIFFYIILNFCGTYRAVHQLTLLPRQY